MPVTTTDAGLRAALRMGNSTEEIAESTRLLAYCTEAVTKHAANAPDVVLNEAVIRLAGYLYDQPFSSRYSGFSASLRNSGAAAMLLPYRVHRAAPAGAPASASPSPSPSPAPTPSGPGVDQVARDKANLAESTATDALNKANEALTDIADLLPLVTAAANPAAATDAEADDPAETGIRSWSSALIARVVRAVGLALPAVPQDGERYTLQSEDTTSEGTLRRFWRRIFEVPATPGTSTGVGHILTTTGENDRDYAWREPAPDATARQAAATANATATLALDRTTANLNALARKEDRFGHRQQLGLVKFTPDPPVLTYAQDSDFARTYRLRVDGPENLTGDIWFSKDIPGLNLNSNDRTKWTGTTFVIDIVVPANRAAAVASAAKPDGILLELKFWDAAREGAVVEVVRVYVGIVEGGSVTATAHEIAFDPSTYVYTSQSSGGFNPGGTSKLRGNYPRGLGQSHFTRRIKVGYLVVDPQVENLPSGPVSEFSNASLRNYNEKCLVDFRAGDIQLTILGIELDTAAKRNNWKLRLGSVG